MFRLSEMKFPNHYFKNEDIYVWYNKEDYPIPANANTEEIRKTSHNIISALRQLGSVGKLKFLAVYDKDPPIETLLSDAGFFSWKPQVGYKQGERSMFETMIGSLVGFHGIEPPDYQQLTLFDEEGPPIYVVIAKPDNRLYRILKCLKERSVQIVLLNPPGGDYMFDSVCSVLEHGELLGVGKLIDISMLPEVPDKMDFDIRDCPEYRFDFCITHIVHRIKMRKLCVKARGSKV